MSLVPHPRYRPIVRLGNWFEDICLEQEKIRDFKNARNRGELLVEKTRQLFKNFHNEINLEAPKENVHFGAEVQLIPANFPICEYTSPEVYPALSVTINERIVRHSQKMNEECELTIAASVKPCVRNSFRIISGDEENRTNELLKYGQTFRLECVETQDNPLLLFSAPRSSDLTSMIKSSYYSTKYGEINLPVGLCFKRNCGPGKLVPSAYTNWYCQHIDPNYRFETEGTPLPSNKPLVITHAATNRNLAAENVIIQTLFGPVNIRNGLNCIAGIGKTPINSLKYFKQNRILNKTTIGI